MDGVCEKRCIEERRKSMSKGKEEWVVSLDGENYNGYMTYPTKKAAIEAGRKEFANVKKISIFRNF